MRAERQNVNFVRVSRKQTLKAGNASKQIAKDIVHYYLIISFMGRFFFVLGLLFSRK